MHKVLGSTLAQREKENISLKPGIQLKTRKLGTGDLMSDRREQRTSEDWETRLQCPSRG